MSYTIINNFVKPERYSEEAPYPMKPESITVHNTWNVVPAVNEVNFMLGNPDYPSFHVAIDEKHAVQAIPFSRSAWHAGDGPNGKGNRTSIGIEICRSRSYDGKYEKAEANAIVYIAHVLKQYGWGVDRVKFHKDWSGKNCPHRILDENRRAEFMKRVADALADLNKPATKPVSKPAKPATPKPTTRFSDVPKTHPHYDAIERVAKAGIIQGHTDGTYQPDEPVTRAHIAVMLDRILKA